MLLGAPGIDYWYVLQGLARPVLKSRGKEHAMLHCCSTAPPHTVPCHSTERTVWLSTLLTTFQDTIQTLVTASNDEDLMNVVKRDFSLPFRCSQATNEGHRKYTTCARPQPNVRLTSIYRNNICIMCAQVTPRPTPIRPTSLGMETRKVERQTA
jgi:hypothetical protein